MKFVNQSVHHCCVTSFIFPELKPGICSLQIYICGGFNGVQCLETCEFYDPELDQWTAITQMNSLRSGLGVTTYAGKIYAVSTNCQNTTRSNKQQRELRLNSDVLS